MEPRQTCTSKRWERWGQWPGGPREELSGEGEDGAGGSLGVGDVPKAAGRKEGAALSVDALGQGLEVGPREACPGTGGSSGVQSL